MPGKGQAMAFNRRPTQATGYVATIQAAATPTLRGPKGAPAFQRTPQSELSLLATTGFFGQDKFYESAKDSDSRFVALVRQCAKEDWRWLLGFTFWLRNDVNIRSAAVVAGLEGAKMRVELLGAGRKLRRPGEQGSARQLAKAGMSRMDEVGEAMAYWTSKYGRPVGPIKRAFADRLAELDEFTALKYDSDNAAWKLADLISFCHPKATSPAQNDLFAWIIANSREAIPAPDSLPMVQARQLLMAVKPEARRLLLDPVTLRSAGMTRESLAGWLQGPMDAKAYEAMIPSMDYMALLRNLHNFDRAGVSARMRAFVCEKLASPVEVAKSRQLPMRFLSAMRTVESYHWHSALSSALDSSLLMVPTLPGRTLVLVDTSESMDAPLSKESTLKRWDVAAMFGIAWACTSPGVEVHSYSSDYNGPITKQFIPAKGADTASQLIRWVNENYNIDGGTPTAAAMSKLFNGHDRVILLTDEGHDWSSRGVTNAIPADVPLFTFNLAGYRAAGTPSAANRHTFGGLNDQAFKLVKLTEDGVAGNWPWITVEDGKRV